MKKQNFDISIVTPLFNEAENIDRLYTELKRTMNGLEGLTWQWIAVDDHSSDKTRTILKDIAADDSRVLYLRLARNSGSHAASFSGLREASGNSVIVMSGDLQEPPDKVIPALVDSWREGVPVVWMVRDLSASGPVSDPLSARLWRFIVRRYLGLEDLPGSGTDCWLVDRSVVQVIRKHRIRQVSLPLHIRSLGFPCRERLYGKRPRQHGKSAWTLRKKLRLVFNTILAFTNQPLRLSALSAALLACLGFILSMAFLFRFRPAAGPVFPYIFAITAIISASISLTALAVFFIGEYVWKIHRMLVRPDDFTIEERFPARRRGDPRPPF